MEFDVENGQVFLVNKPLGWSSFDVVNKFRYALRKYLGIAKIKVGHAGTLDPLADGLLIICTGKFTKRIEEFQAQEKEYTGTFTFGATTPSFDMEHPVDETFPVEHITPEAIMAAAAALTGEILQVPPVFSAIKVDGKRAYKYARKDREVNLAARPVTLSEFAVTRIALPEVDFRIVCSKGTYIRAVARDFGQQLQSGAYLSALQRTRIGDFRLEDAFTLEELLAKLALKAQ